MDGAQTAYKRLKNKIEEFTDDKKINEVYLKEFEDAINDDLNTPQALQVLWKLVRDEKATGKIKTIEKMDEVFGLDLLKKETTKIPKEIQDLINKRDKSRLEKDWAKSDELRDEIIKLGYEVSDTKDGTTAKKK